MDPHALAQTIADAYSSGTLTESQAIASGETWSVKVNGIDLKPLTLTLD